MYSWKSLLSPICTYFYVHFQTYDSTGERHLECWVWVWAAQCMDSRDLITKVLEDHKNHWGWKGPGRISSAIAVLYSRLPRKVSRWVEFSFQYLIHAVWGKMALPWPAATVGKVGKGLQWLPTKKQMCLRREIHSKQLCPDTSTSVICGQLRVVGTSL